ncbi:hypothetical protein [Lacticaseibacillus suibinensis]|uniref:hypothetical protein n=1 Tax=Lacticaseibacillus suibinensis TaxID=2486011 RepID=UPI001942E6F3|nr:hypothetical protein [Lacticaseibacillus suibinensis]
MQNSRFSKFERWYLYLLFFELFAGGGGRLITFGPLSIRQLLFGGLLVIYLVRLCLDAQARNELAQLFKRPGEPIFWVIAALTGWIFVSGLIGLVNGHAAGLVVTDVLRVIYVLIAFPFFYYIRPARFTMKDFLQVVIWSSFVVGLLTVGISLTAKALPGAEFMKFYDLMNRLLPGDLFFRPSGGVFYKSMFVSMFMLVIGSIAVLDRKATWFVGMVTMLSAVSIVLSESRGLILGYVLGLVVYLLVRLVVYLWGNRQSIATSRKMRVFQVIFLITAFGLSFYFYKNSTIARFGGDLPGERVSVAQDSGSKHEDTSMSSRFILMSDSIKLVRSSAARTVVGHGYGTTIGTRKTGIEMSFIDILVEQGAIGFLLWLAIGLLPLYYYFRSFRRTGELTTVHIGLLASTIAMLLVTNINPFLNSPIGLGFLLAVIMIAYELFDGKQAASRGNMSVNADY